MSRNINDIVNSHATAASSAACVSVSYDESNIFLRSNIIGGIIMTGGIIASAIISIIIQI